jgi:hypothetical protein
MSGHQGEQQQAIATPDTVQFTTEQRIEFLAQLITDRIVEDEANGFPLLRTIQEEGHEPTLQAA